VDAPEPLPRNSSLSHRMRPFLQSGFPAAQRSLHGLCCDCCGPAGSMTTNRRARPFVSIALLMKSHLTSTTWFSRAFEGVQVLRRASSVTCLVCTPSRCVPSQPQSWSGCVVGLSFQTTRNTCADDQARSNLGGYRSNRLDRPRSASCSQRRVDGLSSGFNEFQGGAVYIRGLRVGSWEPRAWA